MAEGLKRASQAAARTRWDGKLTEAEAEFVAEMRHEHDYPGSEWHNFDPDFRQKDLYRLFKLGLFERHVDLNGYRQYRWTEAGRAALAPTQAEGER